MDLSLPFTGRPRTTLLHLALPRRSETGYKRLFATRQHTMMELLSSPQAWLAFATLTALELVLATNTVTSIPVLADPLPEPQRNRARRRGCSWPCSCASA